jgi:oxaloacetate decarboxylase beta subunit
MNEFLHGFIAILGIQYFTLGHFAMIGVGLVLVYLAIRKRFEPLLLLPIGFGAVLTNIPIRDLEECKLEMVSSVQERVEFKVDLGSEGMKLDRLSITEGVSKDFRLRFETVVAQTLSGHDRFQEQVLATQERGPASIQTPVGIYRQLQITGRIESGRIVDRDKLRATVLRHTGMMDPGGFLYLLYHMGVTNQLFPLLIFLGIGAMTDFGPMLANPKTALLGAAAQFGIFTTLLGALALGFDMKEAASIGIIGGADGPTSIYLTTKLADHLLGPIAISAYSYMALVPIIQPPIMRLLTTKAERSIRMEQLKPISKRAKVLFPIGTTILCALLVPSATPLIGVFMLGNLLKECGVVDRLSNTAQNELINIVTIFLSLSVGGKMDAVNFLTLQTISILGLGLAAFMVGTTGGVLLGKLMNVLSGGKVNPLIGAAGVSAVPMAARVAEVEGQKADPENHLLMHAMGPNVAGVIGSAIVAGYFLAMLR